MDRTLIALGIFLSLLLSPASIALEITFLDVGEGEAIIVESGEQVGLIDAGNPMTAWKIVSFLRKENLPSIDVAIITHPHPDHFGGIFQVLPYINVVQRRDNGQNLPAGNDLFRWYTESFRSHNYRALETGEVLNLGDAEIRVLNGVQKGRTDLNQNSLVVMVSHGSSRALLMADAGVTVEKALMSGEQNLSADLLKVGHHGNSGATTQEFLDRVEPMTAVISTNCGNVRGYPTAETLAKLSNRGISTLTTCKEGDITFRSNGSGFVRVK
jgi:competence protein ComEC